MIARKVVNDTCRHMTSYLNVIFLLSVVVGHTAVAATRDDNVPDRMTAREIEVAIRAAMPLPVGSVIFVDQGSKIGVATNLDTRSLLGAKDQTMHVKFSVEKSASRQRVYEVIRAATDRVRAFIAAPVLGSE